MTTIDPTAPDAAATTARINGYITSQPGPKRADMQALHDLVLRIAPQCRLWFLDGKDETGKTVTNPNIGYGFQVMEYADGTTRDFYQVGISANTTGISVYILGIKDKTYLARTYGPDLGKASVTGYCIRFKALKDINLDILGHAIEFGLSARP